MSKFKAGDLALIINDTLYPQNIGFCVQLSELVEPDGEYMSPENERVKNVTGKSVWLVIADGLVCSSGRGYCQKAERNLMPLKGDFQPEQQKAKGVEA